MNHYWKILFALFDNYAYVESGLGELPIDIDLQRGRSAALLVRDRQLLEEFYRSCKIRNLSKRTLDYYAINLSTFLIYAHGHGFKLRETDRTHLNSWILAMLEGPLSRVSINTRLKAIRSFFNFLARERLIDENPVERLSLIKVDKRAKPVLTGTQMELILNSYHCKTFESARNKGLTYMAYDAMLRVGEMCNLRTSDIDLSEKLVRVFGKSRRERVVPISTPTARYLHSYKLRWRDGVPGDALFCLKSGDRISEDRVYKIFKRHSDKVGIDFHPHKLRRSGATEFVKLGGSLAVVQRILGHRDIRTTMAYVNLASSDIIEAHERFSPVANLKR